MTYKVVWDERALKDLKKIDKKKIDKIMTRVETYLARDPEKLGKVLVGKFMGFYRYGYGDYRIVYSILKQEITIAVVRISHRSSIYD